MNNEQVELQVLEAKFDGNVLEMVLAPEDLSEAYTIALFNADFDKDKKAFVPNPDTEKNFNEAIETYLGLDEINEETLASLEGRTLTVYKNNDKVTLWEVQKLLRPALDMVDYTYKAKIVEIRDYETQRRVVVELFDEDTDEQIEGLYFASFNFGQWIKSKEIMLPNEAKKIKAMEKFEEKLLVSWDNADELIGVEIKAEPKRNELGVGAETYLELKKRKPQK